MVDVVNLLGLPIRVAEEVISAVPALVDRTRSQLELTQHILEKLPCSPLHRSAASRPEHAGASDPTSPDAPAATVTDIRTHQHPAPSGAEHDRDRSEPALDDVEDLPEVSADDMATLAELTRDTDIVVLGDEVYEHICYEGEHQSLCRHPELAARSLVVSSFGKTYHITGWKIGYVVGPQALMTEFRKVHQFNVFTLNTPGQLGLAEYMQDAQLMVLKPSLLVSAVNLIDRLPISEGDAKGDDRCDEAAQHASPDRSDADPEVLMSPNTISHVGGSEPGPMTDGSSATGRAHQSRRPAAPNQGRGGCTRRLDRRPSR